MKRLRPVLLGTVLLLWAFVLTGCGQTSALTTTGTIEGTEYDVSAQVGGTLAGLAAHLGGKVSCGQTLGKIDDRQYLLQLDQAHAALAEAKAELSAALAGSRSQEITMAGQEVEKALAQVDAAQAQLDYQKWQSSQDEELFRQGAITKQAYLAQEAAYQSAADQLDQARASYQSALANLNLLQSGSRSQTIDQLSAAVDECRAQVSLARLNLEKTELTAPAAGVIVEKNFSQGELVSPGAPVLTIMDTEHLWLYAYVPENRLNLVHTGQKVKIDVDAYPGRTFTGEITYISPQAEFTPKMVQTSQDRVNLVFKVKIVLSAGSGLDPGMPCDVTF